MPLLPRDFLSQLARDYNLSPEQKEVFLERFGSNKNEQAIAEALHISTNAFRTRMTGVYNKFSIRGKGPGKFHRLRDLLTDKYQKFNPVPITDAIENEVDIEFLRQKIQQKKTKWEPVCLKTGFEVLDHILGGGLRPSSLVIIAGRPGMGKSSFLASIVHHVATVDRKSVVFFSLQYSSEQLFYRLLEIQTQLAFQPNQKHTEINGAIISDAVVKFNNTSLIIDDTPGISTSQIESTCLNLAKEKGLDFAVIDGLELLDYETSFSFEQGILQAVRNIKKLAMVLDIPFILTCAVGRSAEERVAKRPIISDLDEYGVLEIISDVILFLYRDDVYNMDDSKDRGIGEVIVAKNRYGSAGVARLGFFRELGFFHNIETIN